MYSSAWGFWAANTKLHEPQTGLSPILRIRYSEAT